MRKTLWTLNIGNLPEALRETVVSEARNRVAVGWADGKSPTDWT
jgi:hypothetical protein